MPHHRRRKDRTASPYFSDASYIKLQGSPLDEALSYRECGISDFDFEVFVQPHLRNCERYTLYYYTRLIENVYGLLVRAPKISGAPR